MNAKGFYKEFVKQTNENRIVDGKVLFDIYKQNAPYTKLVTSIINSIIDSAGYTHQNEYFRIDAIGWTSHGQDMKNDPDKKELKLNAHLWDLKIAVEHENSKFDWTDEVMKLIHVKCPLKIIIGYNYCDERDEMEIKKLSFVSKWMQEIEALQKGKDEEYLIILGNGSNYKSGKSDYTSIDYRGYLYNWNTRQFEKLHFD